MHSSPHRGRNYIITFVSTRREDKLNGFLSFSNDSSYMFLAYTVCFHAIFVSLCLCLLHPWMECPQTQLCFLKSFFIFPSPKQLMHNQKSPQWDTYTSIYIYITVLGLHCRVQALKCSDSVTVSCRPTCPMACGILVPWPGIRPASPALEGRFPTTGPQGKSPRWT